MMEEKQNQMPNNVSPFRPRAVCKKGWVRWVILGVVFLYAMITIISQQGTLNRLSQDRKNLQAKEQELQQQIEMLQSKLDYMTTDEAMEKLAREKLGWVKDGEIIFKPQKTDEKADGES